MPLGFGIIGCGMISRFHARAIGDVRGAKLIGGYDRVPELAQKLSEATGCKVYRSMDVLTYDFRNWPKRLPRGTSSKKLLEALRQAVTDLDMVTALLLAGETLPTAQRHSLEKLAGQVYFSVAR